MERTAEYCLTQIFHYLVNGLAAIVFFCCIAYSGYALWDNWSILKEPDQVREDLIRYKPANEEELSYSFQELKAMNPDVCGWLTLDHTKIDYPVVQGTDNFEYLEKDVLGNPSVAGSIFLDAKSDRNFHDFICRAEKCSGILIYIPMLLSLKKIQPGHFTWKAGS